MAASKDIYQVNLEELISNYVWKRFKSRKNFLKKVFLRRSDYQFDIRWGYIKFTHVTNPREDGAEGKSGDTNGDQKQPSAKDEDKSTDESKATDGDKVAETKLEEKSVIQKAREQCKPEILEAKKKDMELYFSEYENKTATPQTYKFTTTRQTTESTAIEMQENYTLGVTTNLSVNLGDIVSLGTEVTGSLSVTETKSQSYSKSLTWNIDTEIIVPSWNKATATLYVYEMQTTSNFLVKTTLRLPTGNLPVSVIRRKDGKEVFVGWIKNLGILFDEDYRRRSNVKVFEEEVVRDGRRKNVNVVELVSRGICRHVGFKNQHVEVECTPIPNSPFKRSQTTNTGENGS